MFLQSNSVISSSVGEDKLLSEGELESDDNAETVIVKKPPPAITTRKRRHTDGATGQEEDQTPSSSPRQLIAPSFPQPDLSQNNTRSGTARLTEAKQSVKILLPEQEMDNIFNTSLPLLGQSRPSQPQAAPSLHPGLSIAQQQLHDEMKCPLPLPAWLVMALAGLSSKANRIHANVVNFGHGGKKKKKREKRSMGKWFMKCISFA